MPKLTYRTFLAATCLFAAAVLMAAPAAGSGVEGRPVAKAPVPRRCAGADASAVTSSPGTMRSAVVCLVNRERTKRGLPALAVSTQLNRSAQGWTNTMVRTGLFTHGPGTAFARRIGAYGYEWETAGENIATGFLTPRSVVVAWMASADHCRNILNPSFRDVGTGERPIAVGAFASGPATWTQDFGLRIRTRAGSRNRHSMNGCPY